MKILLFHLNTVSLSLHSSHNLLKLTIIYLIQFAMGWWGVRVGIQTCVSPHLSDHYNTQAGGLQNTPTIFQKNQVFSCIAILASASRKWTTFNVKLLLLQKHTSHMVTNQHQQSLQTEAGLRKPCWQRTPCRNPACLCKTLTAHFIILVQVPIQDLILKIPSAFSFPNWLTFCKGKPNLTFYAKRV